eukprot:TRINITY_DN4149_c0_g1_i2.p3 TRINITY_DN4149_c0_g1~~TRINITY_DN4149_c0_g1_i2.p3  ORF type:complete len:119 (-),score=20.78 TRINITY_DN4149_c0_g1_i2:36-362(-)
MEANKEQAEKCIAMARGLIVSGNYEKAERLLQKSIKMFPTAEAQRYLSDIDRLSSQSSGSAPSAARAPSPNRSRAPPSSPESHAPSGPAYSPDQVEVVRRVPSGNNHY